MPPFEVKDGEQENKEAHRKEEIEIHTAHLREEAITLPKKTQSTKARISQIPCTLR